LKLLYLRGPSNNFII